MAGCQPDELFAPGDEKWVRHYDECADLMLNHDREGHFEVPVSARAQHFQALLEGVRCGLNVRHVSLEVRIARVPNQCDRIDSWEQLMQKLDVLWSQKAHKKARTGQVTGRSAETCNKTNLDRIGAGREDNRDRLGRCLCRQRRWHIVCVNHTYVAAHQFGRKGW